MTETGIEFEMTVFIKADSKQVWESLVNPDIVKRYHFIPLIKPVESVGDDVSYGFENNRMIAGKAIEIDRGKKLSHSFVFNPDSHAGTEEDQASVVIYEISEQDGLSILTLTHRGFKERNQTYENVVGGWPYILSSLKTLLETGKSLQEYSHV
jgi:uncharacterized protein YndB with AHSA1/START domain